MFRCSVPPPPPPPSRFLHPPHPSYLTVLSLAYIMIMVLVPFLPLPANGKKEELQ